MFASDRDFTDLTDNMNASFLPCRSLRGVCVGLGIHTFRTLKKEWCEFMQVHVRVQEPTKEPTTRKCCVCSAPIIGYNFGCVHCRDVIMNNNVIRNNLFTDRYSLNQ